MQKLSFLKFNELDPLWSAEDILKFCTAMEKRHLAYLDQEHFEIQAGMNKSQIQICVRLKKKNQNEEYPIECLIVRQDLEKDPQQMALLVLDYIDHYWSHYFQEQRDVLLPIDWSAHQCEAETFYLRGFVRKTLLEAEADLLLMQHGHGNYDIQSISSEA